MVVIQVLGDIRDCAVGVIDAGLTLILEVFFFDQIEEFLLQHILGFYHLAPLLNLGHMVLDLPWYFGCSCVGSKRIHLWGTVRDYKVMPGDCTVRGLMHRDTNKTMMSATMFGVNGWSIGLDFAVNLTDDIVVYHPLKFCDGIEREFGANIFGFGNNFWVQFHQIRWDESCRGSTAPCLVA